MFQEIPMGSAYETARNHLIASHRPPEPKTSTGTPVTESTRVPSNDSGVQAIVKSITESKPFLDQVCKRFPQLGQDPDFRSFVDKLAPALAIANALRS